MKNKRKTVKSGDICVRVKVQKTEQKLRNVTEMYKNKKWKTYENKWRDKEMRARGFGACVRHW